MWKRHQTLRALRRLHRSTRLPVSGPDAPTLELGNQSSSFMSSTEVKLVWERTTCQEGAAAETCDHRYRTIHLMQQHQTPYKNMTLKKLDESVVAVRQESETSRSKSGSEVEGVPDSVLQFERQKRKFAHDKVLGITPNSLDVVYHDDHIVVVNKPSGVLTVPGLNGRPSILDLVYDNYAKIDDDEPMMKEHMICHRLDMDTSGLVVFGRSRSITQKMQAQFRDRQVEKEYKAVLMGHWPLEHCDKGRIDLPLQKDVSHPPFMRVSTPEYQAEALEALDHLQRAGWIKLIRKAPKPSQTDFAIESIGTTPSHKLPYTKIRLAPETGRTHQLRVHCAAVGFPIVGDSTYSLYGEAAHNGGLSKEDRILQLVGEPHHLQYSEAVGPEDDKFIPVPRTPLSIQKEWTIAYPPDVNPMCLHAYKLSFYHPVRGDEKLSFEEEPTFESFLEEL